MTACWQPWPVFRETAMDNCALVMALAFVLDLIWGDPVYPFHPVRMMGRAIAGIENRLRRMGWSGFGGGCLLVLGTLAVVIGSYGGLYLLAKAVHPWAIVLWDVFLVYSCMAFRDLFVHARKVADALEEEDLPRARRAVQMMVGRDALLLDRFGVARAGVESVAESFVDGLLSPVFWFALGGLGAGLMGLSPCPGAMIGILAYRAINTMDSMVGYQSRPYLFFGRAAARLDDVANFLPARLSLPMIGLAALVSRMDAAHCLRVGFRDRLKHASPNSAHAESCVAGALGLRLGGPTIYPSGPVDKPWLGDGHEHASHAHIRQCCRLMAWAGGLSISFICLLFWVI